jgi:hypothetical protein
MSPANDARENHHVIRYDKCSFLSEMFVCPPIGPPSTELSARNKIMINRGATNCNSLTEHGVDVNWRRRVLFRHRFHIAVVPNTAGRVVLRHELRTLQSKTFSDINTKSVKSTLSLPRTMAFSVTVPFTWPACLEEAFT